MTKGTLSIHSENILPIIKKWLYSEKEIFLRELISNACDAILKLKYLQNENKAPHTPAFKIDISIDKEAKTIKIIDNGIGMTQEEVEKYIAQIAFSGAEEFISKYQNSTEKEQFIGHFGLGFYSAYMVAARVEIKTLSYLENAEPIFWSCDGSNEYDIAPSDKKEIGTEITLHLAEDSLEYLDEGKLKALLMRFCPYLPYPIHLNDKHINNKDPLYLKAPADCTDKEYLDFYRELHPFEPEPIFWVHLNVDYPFHLKGILYFPKIKNSFDFNKTVVKLFCNRVFVSDSCRDLLPDYLSILRGAIDSPDIPLNVSRSYLQVDKTVRQVGSHIAKKIADRLQKLFETDREKFASLWPDMESIIKLGILQDEKFSERASTFLIFKNMADEWITLEEYQTRNKEKTGDKVFYNQGDKRLDSFLELYRSKDIEIIRVNEHIDTALLNHLERKHSPTVFQRIDGGVDEALLDPAREKSLLNADGRSEAALMADFIKEAIALDGLEIMAKSLTGETLPGFILLDEKERRFRDYLQMTRQEEMSPFAAKKTFVVNTNSALVQKAYAMRQEKPELSRGIIKQLYRLAMLSQKELPADTLPDYIKESHALLEQLLVSKT